jgi:transposase InsO family protein
MKVDSQAIADALRVTKRSVELRSNRENWTFTLEAVRGGQRKVFTLANLPAEVARAVKRHVDISSKGRIASHVLAQLADLRAADAKRSAEKKAQGEENLKRLNAVTSASVQARFNGRLEIVMGWESWFCSKQPMGKKQSYWAYAEAFNARETPISAAIWEQFQPLKGRSVESWALSYAKQGAGALLDKWDGKAKKDVNVFTKNASLQATTVRLLMDRPHLSLASLEIMLQQASVAPETGEVLFEAPSYHALRRFVNRWKEQNAELFVFCTNPDQWKNTHMNAWGSLSEDVVRLNQRWEMDATPMDWMLQDEDGVRRYSGSVVIRVYDRAAMVLLSRTPRAETHKLLLRMAILAWGVPEEIVTDNGADYVSREMVATFSSLEISHHRTAPYSPEEKGHVERMNETVLHSILEVYSSFIGHDVGERKAIEARNSFAQRLNTPDIKALELAMPASLLQQRLNQWLTGVYAQRSHGGEGMNGMSPFQKAAAYSGEVQRIADVRALDVLLSAPAGKGSYTIGKKGLRIQGAQFLAMELATLSGKVVDVKETDDFGQVVVYREGKFVCVARCPERSGINRQELATHSRAVQRKNLSEQRKQARLTKIDPDVLVSSYLQEKAEAAGKLAALPAPAKSYTTESLKASGQAARMLDGVIPAAEIPADLQLTMHKRALATKAHAAAALEPAAPTKIAVIPETPQLRFRKWLDLDDLLKTGGLIEEPTLTRWYGTYPQTAEHASMMRRHKDATSGARSAAVTALRP